MSLRWSGAFPSACSGAMYVGVNAATVARSDSLRSARATANPVSTAAPSGFTITFPGPRTSSTARNHRPSTSPTSRIRAMFSCASSDAFFAWSWSSPRNVKSLANAGRIRCRTT